MINSRISTFRLRSQMILLVLVIFTPIFCILIFIGFRQYKQALENTEKDIQHLIRMFIDEQESVARQTHDFLKTIAQVPAVRDLELEGCNAFLKAIHQHNPQYSTIVVANADGLIDCCAIPLKKTINVQDRSWFKRISASREFIIDNFIISRSAFRASLPFAYPVLNKSGKLQVAVGAAYDLQHYQAMLEKNPLPEGARVYIADRNGRTLFQSVNDKQCMGKPLQDCTGIPFPRDIRGQFDLSDKDGVARSYWYQRVTVGQESNRIYLIIGIEKDNIYAEAESSLQASLTLMSLVAVLTLIITTLYGRKVILEPIKFLLQKTRQVQQGELTMPQIDRVMPQELTELSTAFNQMVTDLSIRETERDRAENALRENAQQLEDSLAEKDILLKELYHRTKNNMQLISSMLVLHAAQYNDQNIRDLVRETENRIQAMSLVHQMLYQSSDLSRIDMNQYIRELADTLMRSYESDIRDIAVKLDLDGAMVSIETAIPLGLVINELISNSIEHAFPGKENGRIHISTTQKNQGHIKLIHADDGIGFAADFDPRAQETLGLRMVFAIVEQQLNGTVNFESANGLTCVIEIAELS